MDLPPQPDFQRLTQSLTGAVNQIALIPNLPTINDSQTIITQLQNILNAVNTLRNEVTTLRDDIANINIRFDAR